MRSPPNLMEVTSVFSHSTPFMEAVEKLFSPPIPSVDVGNSMSIDSVIEENKTYKYVCFCNIHAHCLFVCFTWIRLLKDILSRSSVRY